MSLLLWGIPLVVTAYIAGYLSHVREWPQLKEYQVWRWLRQNYFKFRATGEVLPTPPQEPVIYAIYPHGQYSLTLLLYFALNPKFKAAKAAVHSALFYLPLFSTVLGWIGATSVAEEDLKRHLRQGTSIYMIPGGLADIANTGLDVKKRSGFLRVARETGAKVVPLWCPMDRYYYRQYLPFGRVFERFSYFPIPLLLWGVWWCPLLPRSPPVDSPIHVGRLIDPNRDDFWQEFEQLQQVKKTK